MIFSNSKKNFFVKSALKFKEYKVKEKKIILEDLEKDLIVAKAILNHMRKTDHHNLIPVYRKKLKKIKEKINERMLKDL